MNAYTEWTGTVKLPTGPWAETHEFTGEIRRASKGDCYVDWDLDVLRPVASVWSSVSISIFAYPILRRKKPKWQPPVHLIGTGWRLGRSLGGLLFLRGKGFGDHSIYLQNEHGDLSKYGTLAMLDPNNLPDLKPGEEIIL